MSWRVSLLTLVLAVPSAFSGPRFHLGGIVVGGGYSSFSGLYPYWGYSRWYYDPFLFAPFYAPGYLTGFAYQPNMGAVKLEGANKDSWVYLNGALAGRSGKLKQMWLEPGAYDLELRDGNRVSAQRIYVLSGKTLNITPQVMEARP